MRRNAAHAAPVRFRLGRLRLCRGHVLLEDLTALAGAGHVLRIDARLGELLARRRARRHLSLVGISRSAGTALAAAGAGAGFGAAGFSAFACTAAPPLLMAPSRAPTATVCPSVTLMSPSTPEMGAGTSTVTLSVSSSTSGSSTLTASPDFLNHLPTIASVTLSPRVGTRISVAISNLTSPRRSSSASPPNNREALSLHPSVPPRPATSARRGASTIDPSPSRPTPGARRRIGRLCLASMRSSTQVRFGSMKLQAPMFFGSSWHQTISACVKRPSSCISARAGNG